MAVEESCVGLRPPSDYAAAYVRSTPIAHALFRTSELALLSTVNLPRPMLDLGCGTGQFAEFALQDQVDVGLDICRRRLAHAKSIYARCVPADARQMPFPDATFRTVISVSALEHMQDPQQVLYEVLRVLAPGGRFVGTITLRELHDHLFYPKLFHQLGLGILGKWYTAIQDRCFNHCTLLTAEQWQDLMQQAGFRIVSCEKVVSPRLTRWWDALLPLALPYWLMGKPRWLCRLRPRWLTRRFQGWIERMLAQESPGDGSVLFFVAEKPPSERDESIEREIEPYPQRETVLLT